jgi:tRNA A37 threonylcarbamoyladenosine dehydratase
LNARQEFFTAASAESILGGAKFDFVLDAIDALAAKVTLIVECHRRKIAMVVSGSAGGRIDGTAARIADLARASHDPLLQKVRKRLRSEFGFPAEGKGEFGVPCVFSAEAPTRPERCEVGEEGLRMDCNSGYGSVTFVTGAFGFAAAGLIVSRIAREAVESQITKAQMTKE